MLPKVSSALAQLIKPIAPRAVNSQEKREGSSQQESAFQRFKKPSASAPAAEPDPTENKIIPFPLKAGAPPGSPPVVRGTPADPDAPPKPGGLGLTDALLQLKAVIQEQSAQVTQWVAGKKYKTESQSKKKAVTSRRGAIVDHKAE